MQYGSYIKDKKKKGGGGGGKIKQFLGDKTMKKGKEITNNMIQENGPLKGEEWWRYIRKSI